ncbi:LysR family transcriptional regulator [Shewanella sp. WXL01]|uniref:LysR family transcriptional regulator n=1 Tax=Shewanella sp. WXL01 TaxID=2709721 RepID=UPI0014382AE4|nr:LysR family transcriptional regulator [Shewanella sp. WXL01]NKF50240.1 LysR family transcriptional regulator [Shewanella sp. WXL01]
MLSPNCLKTFITLVDVGHFGQTAERLFMTQPGVTQHVKKLEQELKRPLLNRLGKGFEVTREGQALYQYAKRLFAEHSEFIATLDKDDATQGECRIASSGSMAMQLYSKLIEHQTNHPNLTIMLEAAPNKSIINHVIDGDIELGLITQQISHPLLNVVQLGEQRLCVVIPKDEPHRMWDFDALLELGMINHPDGQHYWLSFVRHYFAKAMPLAHEVNVRGFVNQLNQILLPVSQGLGFAVLPEFAVKHSPYYDKVTIADFDQFNSVNVTEPLLMISNNQRQLPSRYKAVIDIIRANI